MSLVRYDVDRAIGTITLNRPDKLNALSVDLGRKLLDAVREAGRDARARAVVLTGAGRAFSAGGDIDDMRRLVDAGDWDTLRTLLRAGADLAKALVALPQPTVAAVNGPAAGAGGSLALACDLRVAADTASFGLVFARLGLVPDFGGTYFLPRIVGSAKALELILGGEMIDAAEAARLGIFNRVVPAHELPAAARDTAARFAAKAPLAIRLARQAVYDSFNTTLDAIAEVEIENQLRCFKTGDAGEGLAAFLEKRPPAFRGE